MNRQNTLTAVVTLGLLAFVGWAFWQHLGTVDKKENYPTATMQKAVMAQAEALNQARLDELSERGQAAIGMSMEQVRAALGAPTRTLVDSSGGEVHSTWWYEREGSRVIRFAADGKVSHIAH